MSSNNPNNPNKGTRRGGRRRRGEGKRRGAKPQKKLYLPPEVPERVYQPCPICGEQINDIRTALADPDTDNPVHFDCVLSRLKEKERLDKDEQLCYIGQGSFGVIRQTGNNGAFEILRRIPFEPADKGTGWRSELSPGLSRHDWPSDPEDDKPEEQDMSASSHGEPAGS